MIDKKGNKISRFMFQLAACDSCKSFYDFGDQSLCAVCGLNKGEKLNYFKRVRICEKCYDKHHKDIIAIQMNVKRSGF